MKKMFCYFIGFTLLCNFSFSQTVTVGYAAASPKQVYAAGILEQTFSKHGYAYKKSGAEYTVNFLIDKKLGNEAFSIKPSVKRLTITGGDESGILYGSLSVAEDLRNGVSFQNIEAKSEAPKLPFRAIKYDLPWDTYRHSYALDLHSETCKDVAYWMA